MKEVTIKSKIVGRGGASAATSPGKGVSVDMSGYLLKQIWEKVFEFRLTDDGTEYLFAKMDMAVQGGITMYANGGNLDLPSIYDGLPLDNDTIYWEETKDEEGNVIARILKSRGVGEGGVTPTLLGDLTNVGSWANGVAAEDRIMVQKKGSSSWEALELSKIGGSADFSNVKESGSGNAFTSFVLSEDKKTLTFVKGKNFAGKSDTLSGYGITDAYTKTEANSLLAKKWTQDNNKIANWDTAYGWGDHSKAGYASKSTTLAGYGITNAYTKTQVDSLLEGFITSDDVEVLLEGYLPLAGGTMTGTIQSQIIRPKTNNAYSLGTSSYLWSNVYTKLATIDGIEIKKSASGVLYIGGNLVVSGGITMYGTDGTSAPSIWDGAPKATTTNNPSGKGIASFDSKFFSVNNGHVSFIGDVGGGGGKNLNITLPDGTTKVEYNGDAEKSIVLTRLYKSEEVTTATTDEGTITPLAMNTWTTSQFPLKNGKGATGKWNIDIKGNAATATTASKLSTTSKAAWGKTYWTSGGVPTDISGDMSSVGNILSSGTNTYELGSSSNKWKSVHANCLSFGNEVNARLATKGWYRFAVGGDENDYGGSFIFFIRRSYKNVKTESFVISATVGYGRVVFNQLSGAVSGSLITKVRATNYADNVIYFDLYYEGSTNGHVVYVNAVGDVTIQTPTFVSSAYSYTTEFTLGDGMVAGKALTCFDYKGLAYIRQKFGKNLLTNGDNYGGSAAYNFAAYNYASFVEVGRTYRLTICGKLGEENTHIGAYWDGGGGNNTLITSLSSKEERVISITAKITNINDKQRVLNFYQFPSDKFGSYIRWAYLEEAYNKGELSTTTDYNNWLTEYNKLDARSFLYKIQRIDVGDSSYWSADKGLNLIDANAYALTMKRTASSGGTFIKMMANNQSTQSWASGVNNAHQFSWWYQNGTSDVEKMKLDATGSLMSDYWKISNSLTNPYLMLTQGSTWYIQGFEGYLYLGAGSAKSMRIDSSGNVLSVGGITMYSDLRKKTILNHVELSLKEVADAPLIEHYYNSDESKRTHVGSIAQYWAGINDWFCKEDGEGFLTMEIQNAALASAISVARELTRYESKTDEQIKKLKKRIGELEEEIENLKKV